MSPIRSAIGPMGAKGFGMEAASAPTPTPTPTPTRTPTPTPTPTITPTPAPTATPTPTPAPTATPTPTPTVTRTPTPTPCPSYGTFLSYSGTCSGTTFNVSKVLANGSCGSYTESYKSLLINQYCGSSLDPYVYFYLLVNGNYYPYELSIGPRYTRWQTGAQGPGYNNLQFIEGGSFSGKILFLQANTNPLFNIYAADPNFTSYATQTYLQNASISQNSDTVGGYSGYVDVWNFTYPGPAGNDYISISY